jgi:site-specific DNA recombinase
MKYILYCRKSTDTDDKQVLSLDSQETELKQLASQLGLTITKTLRESQSAKEPGRPLFNSMLDEIATGKADGIICWKIDRLTRNPVDGGRIQWLLQQNKIKSIATPGRMYDPRDNVLLMSIEQAMATQYIRDLSDNVKRGNRTKLEQGGWPNRAPFGYKNEKGTKTLVVDKKQAKLVTRVFALYSTGTYSVNQLRKVLTAEGFRTNSGTSVGKSLIERIIKNPFYSGVMLSHGTYYEGKHVPIVSRELYELAQNVLLGTSRPKATKHFYPLRGTLLCGNCSCMYTANTKKGHIYYYCTNGKGTCDAHSRYLQSKLATELVSVALREVHFPMEAIEIMVDAKREMYADKYSYTEAIQKRLRSQLEALERQELKAFEDSSSGLLRSELYARKMRELQKSRFIIEKDLNDLKLQDGLDTLEPVKSLFIQGNTAQSRFLNAEPEQQKNVVNEILWNLYLKDGKTIETKYKTPFAVMANASKTAELETMLAE